MNLYESPAAFTKAVCVSHWKVHCTEPFNGLVHPALLDDVNFEKGNEGLKG